MEKQTWGTGPWLDEPDRVEWQHLGVPCLLVRGDVTGAWCGYAAAPPGHPWHGKSTSELGSVSAHGGITFSGPLDDHDGTWWVGFDCAHAFDHLPALMRFLGGAIGPCGVYRTIDYAKAETEHLAEQLVASASDAADELLPVLWRGDFLATRIVPGRGLCGAQRFLYTCGLIVNMRFDGLAYDFDARYCYPTAADARRALLQWDGIDDPPGPWIKEKLSERSRPTAEE